ncbi:MAG TPA: hypothetical protein VK712_01755 [Verrucomicrobiae bacterium]|jgi:hypothetical protein|nr:hypothetical protein [Verrucomicrobiae bacterium]
MADQTTNDSKDPDVIARTAITELVPGIIRELVPQIINETVPGIIHRETADIRADVKIIKRVQGQQGMMLRATQTDVNHLKTSYRQQAEGMTKLGVLLEDLEHRFMGTTELN